jgi:hypothetical protein
VQRLRFSPKETTDSGSLKPDEIKRNRIIKRAAKEFQDGMYGILLIRAVLARQQKTGLFGFSGYAKNQPILIPTLGSALLLML